MTSAATKPVIVGIDGSERARHAARWAVDETAARCVPMRLVYVIRTDFSGPLAADEYRTALDDAKAALHLAKAEVDATGRPVAVTTEIVQGAPAAALLAESPDASMICLGSSGIGRLSQAILGSTAATLAEGASCPVAIVRSPRDGKPPHAQTHWVMVPVSIFSDNDVIDVALDQARLLGRPVLAVGVMDRRRGATPTSDLDLMVAKWREQNPDVHIHPVWTDGPMSQFTNDNPDIAGMVVIDAAAADEVSSIIGREHHSHPTEAEHAVLVARHYVIQLPAPSVSVASVSPIE